MSVARIHETRSPAAWVIVLALLTACAIALPATGAAASAATWKAGVGAAGANGTATITAPASAGTAGSLKLALKGLAASTPYPVKIVKGTCAAPGAVLYAGPAQRSTPAGRIAKTLAIPAAKMNAIRAASAAALRVGSGSKLRCGPFTGGPAPTPTASPTPVPTLGPAQVTARITVGAYPTSVATDGQMVYVGNSHDWSISRVDPKSNSVLNVYQLTLSGKSGIADLVYAETSLWAATPSVSDSDEDLAGSVVRVDPASGQTLATIAVGKAPLRLAASPGAVWVANYADGSVMRIDTATNAVVATVTVGGRPTGLAYDYGSVWVGDEKGGSLNRIDPATNKVVATIHTVPAPEGVASAAGFVWVANYGVGSLALGVLSKIDPATN